jgi:hypothetical protein
MRNHRHRRIEISTILRMTTLDQYDPSIPIHPLDERDTNLTRVQVVRDSDASLCYA